MIAILKRDDLCAVLYVTQTDQPWEVAEGLCPDHIFDVEVMATMHADLDGVSKALNDCRICGGWYRCSLQRIFEVCAKLCVEEPCDKEGDNSAMQEDSVSEQTELPSCLSFCQAVHAPLATSLRQDLVQLLGKEKARLVIQQLTPKTTRRGTETCRLFSFRGEPVALNS